MADPLSLAASILAVIGAADVVLRASIEASCFLVNIKGAPTEIEHLRTCLQENTLLLETSKHYLEELRGRISSSIISLETTRLSEALSHFTSATKALEREIVSLTAIARKYPGVKKSWELFKFVLDGRKVGRSLQRLESSKSALTTALVLLGRRDSALEGKEFARAVGRNFERLTSGANTAFALINDNHEKLLIQQGEIAKSTTRHRKETALARKDLCNASHVSRKEHKRTRVHVTASTSKIINTMASGFDDMRITISKTAVTAPKSDREVFFVGEHRASMLTPLLLLKDHLRSAVLQILSQQADKVSPHYLYWLQSEFENLVASATQEVAALSHGSTATAFDRWSYQEGATVSSATRTHTHAYIFGQSSRFTQKPSIPLQDSSEKALPSQSSRANMSIAIGGPSGKLRLAFPTSNKPSSTSDNGEEVSFWFMPPAHVCTTALAARFVKILDLGFPPRLYTQLNAFTLVEDDTLHRDLMLEASIQDIDAALRSGTISPYHVCIDGDPVCLWYAACFGRVDLLQYFDSQGIGMSNLNDTSILDGIWSYIWSGGLTGMTQSILDYCKERCADLAFLFHSSYVLLSAGLACLPAYSDESIEFARRFMTFLKSEGFSLNWRVGSGIRTPLLDHAYSTGSRSLTMVRLLFELGADVNTTDDAGHNALHLALLPHPADHDDLPELVEEKLTFFIKAGVNVHHRDRWGETPSYRARIHSNYWEEWCRALERNGLSVKEVVKVDGEEWILKGRAEEERGLAGNL